MGIRNTEDEGVVALFDSVTGFAFGPTFDTADEAESFLVFVREVEPRVIHRLNHDELAVLKQEFEDAVAAGEFEVAGADSQWLVKP